MWGNRSKSKKRRYLWQSFDHLPKLLFIFGCKMYTTLWNALSIVFDAALNNTFLTAHKRSTCICEYIAGDRFNSTCPYFFSRAFPLWVFSLLWYILHTPFFPPVLLTGIYFSRFNADTEKLVQISLKVQCHETPHYWMPSGFLIHKQNEFSKLL